RRCTVTTSAARSRTAWCRSATGGTQTRCATWLLSTTRSAMPRRAQDKLADALASYLRSHAIRDELTKHDPGNQRWQRDLAQSYVKIGHLYVQLGKLAQAENSYRLGLEITERLARSEPKNASWQRDLASAHDSIGDLFRFRTTPDGFLLA